MLEWLWLPLIVAFSLLYYAHKNGLKHKETLREIDLKEKQIELEMMRERNRSTNDKKGEG
ncbi:hypothetical protein [Pseudalkalibacillus berkeleyi]|uniref:SigE-dependent sporulation protein n=1 Tax=Pseudalkalibacillus berkeleyi TaxID=1069813 RepID=A0ABS9H5G4_9BACL|nr:hypothetical protein [Pseudalkalibacillus berkeleyi]MCF6139184.1 hypothetical protein [Pseudalkalibacillus berkeleyi]